MNEETLQIVMNYRLFDDNFANVVFLDKKCIEYVLSIILQEDNRLKRHTCQHHVKNLNKKSVTLDIYGLDNKNRYINLEIQSYKSGSSLLRARYHVSIIDTSVTATRTIWKDLKDVYVIFITEKDYLGGGKPIYYIDRTCEDMDINDGAHIIYVNGENKDDTPLGRLMYDFRCVNPEDMHDSILKDRTMSIKNSQEEVKKMCEAVEKYAKKKANQAVEKYAKKKAKEEKRNIAKKMISLGLSLEMISEITSLNIDEIKSLTA